MLYENPACAAAAVVVDPLGRVLLIRRALEPYRGAWALPAGYQEIDEEPSATAEREVREETGVRVEAREVFDVMLVRESARKPTTLAVYLCRWISGEPHDDDDESPLERVSDDFDLEEACADAELMDHVAAAMQTLPPIQRTLVTLYHLDELGIGEIARITELPEGTVKNYLYRARLRLRQALQGKLGALA